MVKVSNEHPITPTVETGGCSSIKVDSGHQCEQAGSTSDEKQQTSNIVTATVQNENEIKKKLADNGASPGQSKRLRPWGHLEMLSEKELL